MRDGHGWINLKKVVKFLLFVVLATIVLFFGLVLLVANSPGMQKRMVLAVLEGATSATPRVDSVRMGQSRAEIHGFQLGAGQEHLRVAALEVRYSAGSFLRGRPRIDQLDLTGLEIDIAATRCAGGF